MPPSMGDDRRSSVYQQRTSSISGGLSHRHQSFFQAAPQLAGVPKDPRPLRNGQYQAKIGQELLDYLAQNNFEMEMKHPLSRNCLKSPTQKDFNLMFQWFYHRLDPSYRFQKAIDQEIPPLLKQIRYPFEKSITRSQLAAVGGQNWHIFLGVLHWMMQLAKMLDGYAANIYDGACLEAGYDVTPDRITFDFLSSAYKDWLLMDDDATDDDARVALAPHVDRMRQAFEASNERYHQHLQDLEADNARLAREIEKLEDKMPDLAQADSHYQIMEEDKVKFEKYIEQVIQRSEKYERQMQEFRERLAGLESEVTEADEERKSLQQRVSDQGVSMTDIDRMTSEREQLQKLIDGASQRLEDAKRQVASKEADAGGKLENLERMVDRYNTIAYQIGLIPSSAPNASGTNYELQVIVSDGSRFRASQLQQSHKDTTFTDTSNFENERLLVDPVTGYQRSKVLNLDLEGTAKNALLSLRRDISERRGQVMDTMLKDDDLLHNIKAALQAKRNEVEALEHRVRAAEREHEKEKEVTTANRLSSDAQIEKMEKDLVLLKADLYENGQFLEARELGVEIEYDLFTHLVHAHREKLHTETSRMLTDVIKFKMHVQASLEVYEGVVADELEKELALDMDAGEDDEKAGAGEL